MGLGRIWNHRATVDLDPPVALEELDPMCLSSERHAREFVRYLLREAVSGGFNAIHLFFHEEDNLVRCCVWSEGGPMGRTWFELVPMEGARGRDILQAVRKHAGPAKRGEGHVSGWLRYRWEGRCCAMRVESPHAWDVRLYLGTARPDTLPYALVFRPVAEAQQAEAGRQRR